LSFLLDTNVVSEWVKPRPHPGVVSWLGRTDEDEIFLSVITLMELRYGVDCMSSGARQGRLNRWLRDDLPERFEGRLLNVNESVADVCGSLMARRKKVGKPMGAMDAIIGATAITHDLVLVTRNVADFDFPEGRVLNPWSES
jgi:predicted nucleic acid-binding protein